MESSNNKRDKPNLSDLFLAARGSTNAIKPSHHTLVILFSERTVEKVEKDSTIWSLVKKFISSAKGKVTPRLNLIKIRSSQRAIPIYSFKLIAVVLNSGYLSQRNSNSAVKRAALAREPTVPKHERPMKPIYFRNSYPAVSACSIVRF